MLSGLNALSVLQHMCFLSYGSSGVWSDLYYWLLFQNFLPEWGTNPWLMCKIDQIDFENILVHAWPRCKTSFIKILPSQIDLNMSSFVKKVVVEWLLKDLMVQMFFSRYWHLHHGSKKRGKWACLCSDGKGEVNAGSLWTLKWDVIKWNCRTEFWVRNFSLAMCTKGWKWKYWQQAVVV